MSVRLLYWPGFVAGGSGKVVLSLLVSLESYRPFFK